MGPADSPPGGAADATSTTSSGGRATRRAVTLGMTTSESGWAATDSRGSSTAARFWVGDVNARGGLLVSDLGGRLPVRLVTYDDRSDPGVVAALYERLVLDDGIDVALSPATTDLTAEVYPVTERHGVLLVNTMAPDDRLFKHGYANTFLAGMPLSGIYGELPGFFAHHHRQRVAHVYTRRLPGFQVLNEPLPELLAAEPGIELVLERTVPEGHRSWAGLMSELAAARADALVVSLPAPDEAAFLEELHAANTTLGCVVATYAAHVAASEGRFGALTTDDLVGIFGWRYGGGASAERPVTVGYDRDELARRLGSTAPGAQAEGLGTYVGLALWERFVEDAGTLDAAAVMAAAHRASATGAAVTVQGVFEIDGGGCPPLRAAPLTQLQRGVSGAHVVVVFPPAIADADPVFGWPGDHTA